MKRTIACLLLLALLFSTLISCKTPEPEENNDDSSSTENIKTTPTTSSAGLSYSLNDDGKSYTVTGIGYCKEENIVIDTYNNLPVTHVDSHGFSDCSKIKSVTLSDCVKHIGIYAFGSCDNLESITIPSNIETVGDTAFHSTPKLKYNESDNGCYLGNAQNPYLVFVKPMQQDIESITINEETRFIYGDAFVDSSNLKNVDLGNKLVSIGSAAFSYTQIESIVLPDSLKTLGMYAFLGSRLKEITLSKNLEGLSGGVFAQTYISTLTIPDSVEYIESTAFDRCTSLSQVNISENNSHYKTVDGNILTKDGKKFVLFITANGSDTYTVPDGVVEIMDSAFEERGGVYNVILPDSVVRLGDSAFSCCFTLASIKLSKNLKYMGHHVFYNTSLKSIVIPDGVQSIEESAFWRCSDLQNVTLGKGIKKIVSGAFSECYNLTDVYYAGSQADWETIGFNTNATVHFAE